MIWSDTELTQKELAQRTQYAPGNGLVVVNETDIDPGALGAHPQRVKQLDVELEQAEQRLGPLGLGRIECDRAAAARGQRKAWHILLGRRHFPQHARRDRPIQILDDMRLDSGGSLMDQVDVGL